MTNKKLINILANAKVLFDNNESVYVKDDKGKTYTIEAASLTDESDQKIVLHVAELVEE